MEFNNSVAIVTGASRGIGKETARALYEKGCKVVLVSRSQKDLQNCLDEFSSTFPKSHLWAAQVDVANESEVEALCQEVKQKWGPINILVNNAGWIQPAPMDTISTEVFKTHFDINVLGTFLFAKACFGQMKESGKGGAIVNVSSLGGIKGTQKFRGLSAYVGAKSAVTGLTEAWAVDGKPYGIRVNAVAPGAVNTQMLKVAAPFLKTKTEPSDIAKVILFLCDPSSNNKLSGTILEVHSNE
jgi:NAD(P)-dependent dehydrogenase (short-subunit alcohol dehydrogenase family)